MIYKIVINNSENLIRVDSFVANFLEDTSRSQVKKMFTDKLIKVNNEFVKPSYRLKLKDTVEITVILSDDSLKPINLNLETIYEDKHILIINKPAGLVVHPSVSYKKPTLVNHLLYLTNQLSLQGGVDRPGIVHRLDKDTSGLLVVAKTDLAYNSLVSQFKNRTVIRKYLAIVHNNFLEDSGTIKAPIKRHNVKMMVDPTGKEAITHFKVLKQNEDYSFLECSLETGRTHQIRVHLAYINHPLVGDSTYGFKKAFKNHTHALHAETLSFIHPETKELVSFSENPPETFKKLLKKVDLYDA